MAFLSTKPVSAVGSYYTTGSQQLTETREEGLIVPHSFSGVSTHHSGKGIMGKTVQIQRRQPLIGDFTQGEQMLTESLLPQRWRD